MKKFNTAFHFNWSIFLENQMKISHLQAITHFCIKNVYEGFSTEVFLFGLQVLLLIDIQVSYINTNHEDFIGFAKYVKRLIATSIPPAGLVRMHIVNFCYNPTTFESTFCVRINSESTT